MAACLLSLAAHAADEQPRPPASFTPGDISIGEPIALPFAKPTPPREGTPAPQAPASVLATPVPTASAAPAAAPPSAAAAAAPIGWLGLAVAESTIPGRWSIVEVAPNGPAATAGVRTGDELRAIDGVSPRNADEVAQAMTAIAAGQTVRLSVARADQVGDVAIVAVPRPTMAASREWQAAAAQSPPIDSGPSLAAAPSPAMAPPTTSVLVETRGPLPAAARAPLPAPAQVPVPALPAALAPPRGRTALGVRTVPIDPAIQARFHLPEASGAYVVGVVGDLPASKAGIPPGSVIVKLGDNPVRSPQELTQLVAAGPVDRPVPLEYVLPGGTGKRADVVLQSLGQPLEQALVGESLQPTAAPQLQPGPAAQISRRPVTTGDAEAGELRREVGRVRAWLDVLERRLDRLSSGGR